MSIIIPGSFLETYAVLAGTAVTNTGPTTIIGGNVGVSPGSAVTGFPPGLVVPPGTIHIADAHATQAQTELVTAYNTAAGLAPSATLNSELGGQTLVPGVYDFTGGFAQLTGTLTLNTQGDPDALFVFQIASTLTTASNSRVIFINGPTCNVYWQVGSSATLGTGTQFIGNILALTSISLNTGATVIPGRLLARNGAVTLDTNVINNVQCAPASVVPIPTPSPIIFSVIPSSGPDTGGTTVTITGTGFTGTTVVTFGGVPANFTVDATGTVITAITPPHAAGIVNVTVSNPLTSGTLPNAFTYIFTGTITPPRGIPNFKLPCICPCHIKCHCHKQIKCCDKCHEVHECVFCLCIPNNDNEKINGECKCDNCTDEWDSTTKQIKKLDDKFNLSSSSTKKLDKSKRRCKCTQRNK